LSERAWPIALVLLLLSAALLGLGLAIGSTGWSPWLQADEGLRPLLWDIRAPRTLGAWLAGALLALSGAIGQGLFRKAAPQLRLPAQYAGASPAPLRHRLRQPGAIAVSAYELSLWLTGAAFIGSVGAVLLTLMLARGVEQTVAVLAFDLELVGFFHRDPK